MFIKVIGQFLKITGSIFKNIMLHKLVIDAGLAVYNSYMSDGKTVFELGPGMNFDSVDYSYADAGGMLYGYVPQHPVAASSDSFSFSEDYTNGFFLHPVQERIYQAFGDRVEEIEEIEAPDGYSTFVVTLQ